MFDLSESVTSLLIGIGYLALVGSFIVVIVGLIRLLFSQSSAKSGSNALRNRLLTRK